MLSYPIDEAETLLEGKLSGAQQTLANCEEDLDFLREQITVGCVFPIVMGKMANEIHRPLKSQPQGYTTGMSR